MLSTKSMKPGANTMKRLVLLLALVLCLPFPARADEASRLAKAKELTRLLHLERFSSQVIDGIMQQTVTITAQRTGGTVPPETQAALTDIQKKMKDLMEAHIGFNAMQPEFANLYAKLFTEEQMDGIIAFYKSPAGLALMEKMPDLNQQATQLLQARMAELEPQVKQMFAQFVQDKLPKIPVVNATPVPPAAPGAPATGSEADPATTMAPGTPK